MTRDLSTFHSIWLAGLGALARTEQEGARFFEELVRHGHAVEEMRQQVSQAQLQEQQIALDRQIRELRELLDGVSERAAMLESAASMGSVLTVLEEREAAKERMIEALLPKSTILPAPSVLQARRNAAAREGLLQEFGALSSTEVADLAGSRASNKAALANRWKQEGRIFPVTHHGQTLFPAYQFDGKGQPRPVIAQVLSTLGKQSRDWELALWFLSASGWLGEKRPVDLLESNPAAVAEAARHEIDDLVF